MMISLHQFARALGGDIVGRNRILAPGPGHSAKDRSLSIKVKGGDFVVNSFAGDDWQACRDYVNERLGRKLIGAMTEREPVDISDFALELFKQAGDADTPTVHRFFGSRGLRLPADCHHVLRFHPHCPFGSGVRHPCIVALYRDIRTNEPRAIHRTALTPDGRKIDRKALGPKAGCAIKLSADENVHLGLTIGEGIETCLAGMALDFMPAWALGDAGSIMRFPVLPGIESLTILVDHDKSGTGQRSALECSRRWTSHGREVFRVVPTALGADVADIVSAREAA